MIGPSELMLNNVLLWLEDMENPRLVQVKGIGPVQIAFEYKGKTVMDTNVEVVVLKQELLECLGFVWLPDECILKTEKEGIKLTITLSASETSTGFCRMTVDVNCSDGIKDEMYLSGGITYLHTLQNCYASLVGAPLDVGNLFREDASNGKNWF